MSEPEFDMEKWRGRTLTRAEFQDLSAVEMAAFLESGGGGRIIESGFPTMTHAEFERLSEEAKQQFRNRRGRLTG
jgi:hypothetical protein